MMTTTEASIRKQGARRTAAAGWLRRVLAAGVLLLAALVVAGGLQAPPAHADTTFTVNDIRDLPDASTAIGACDIDVFIGGDQCTLRAAIQQANATLGADAIVFAIPGTGVKTIAVGAGGTQGFGPLPPITEQMSIDGYTQPGASPNTKAVGNDAAIKIELSGASAGGKGLELSSASNSSIKGLAINRFGEGITIQGDSVGNRIEGNFVGTDPSGTIDRGNTFEGVDILNGASENVVGGTTPAARNLISGNAFEGVFLSNSGGANRVQGNYIGTDKSGTKDLGNGATGVVLNRGSSGNTVGGTTAGARNVISGNNGDGVGIVGDSRDNRVLGNRIGTAANGTGALGNSDAGVSIQGSNNRLGDGTSAGSNTIAFNGGDGVEIQDGTGNAISRNSIFSNGALGIDLRGGFEDASGNTANDPGDLDTGANGLQNKPVLSSAKTVSGKTTITGKLASTPNLAFKIQFFSNPSGNEGKKFLGEKEVTTDGTGNASVSFSPATTVSAGQTVTATARPARLEATAVGTSEFSAPKTVAS